MSSPLQLTFQDAASYTMKEFNIFHDYSMFYITVIIVLIVYGLFLLLANAPNHWKFVEKQQVELCWTISPSFILLALAVPSINLLYYIDEGTNPSVTVKTIGHQWYWTYEIWDNVRVELDSYMIHLEDLPQIGLPRLLEVDNRLVLPYGLDIRVITSSTDVIHAWCVPVLGFKLDAVPGRLNQTYINISRTGIFYGQCSEICGSNHSFMPIVLESVSPKTFYAWCNKTAAS
uniref:Cytochrome c oxidase subunit 2 n=1 Tax=Ophiomusa kimblae TaxID=3135533 RepID=A0AAU6PWX4_9ECHI